MCPSSSQSGDDGNDDPRARLRPLAASDRDPFNPQLLREYDPITLLVGFGIVLLASIAIGTAAMVNNFRDRAIANAERELKNTSLLLTRHFEQEFRLLTVVQDNVRDRVRSAGIASGEDFERTMSGHGTFTMLKDKNILTQQIASVALIGASGNLINTTRTWPAPPLNVSDHKLFDTLRSATESALIVTEPLHNRVDGDLIVVLARSILSPKGEFMGGILTSIQLGHLQKSLEALATGDYRTISLLRSDGVMLARQPRLDSFIGKTLPLFAEPLGETEIRTTRVTAATDGIDRLLAARRLANVPLAVVVGVDADAVLADWREQTQLLLGMAALAGVVIALILGLVVRKLVQSHKLAEEKSKLEKRRLDAAIENMSQGLLMFDQFRRIAIVNHRYIDMLGVSPDVVKPGCTFRELIQHRKDIGNFAGDVDQYCAIIFGAIAQGKATEHFGDTADGRALKIANNPMAGGGWVATVEDVTRQRDAEQARERDREFLHKIIDNIPMTIYVKNASDRRYVLINNAAEKYIGVTKEKIIGKTVFDLHEKETAKIIADQDEELLRSSGHVFVDEYPLNTPGMGRRYFTSNRLTIFDNNDQPQYLVSVLNDVTERKRADERIAHLALHDSLTDLPNRALFRKQLEDALKAATHDKYIAVLYLDLDNFKDVNDSLGHPAGDALLQAIAERLRGCLRETDTVARLGGDEFAIIQTAVENSHEVTDLARRILETIQQPYIINGQRFTTDTSIGISIAPHDDTDPDQILKNADLALYVAKSEGRSTYRFFAAEMDARMKARRELEVDLRESISNDNFELHYQPIVRLTDGAITGLEALLRWRHPTRGMVSPAEFIPIAEETGLIISLGEWVLRTACAEAMNWPDDIKVAVNVSPVQFRNPVLPLTIVSALSASGLPARRLVLEITEAVLIRDDEVALTMLNQVRALGVEVAMDDFGTGYSSLSYLQRFPFDKIKIDRAFIKDIGTKDGSPAIVQAVVDIARSRDITTTAEGVETKEQLDLLRALGCTEMQGYLFSPAVPASELQKFFHPGEIRLAR